MKISEILKSERPSVSFEIFPPKAAGSTDETLRVIEKLAPLRPSYISVTCRSGSTPDYTLDVAAAVEKHGIPALAHLTCFSSTRSEADRLTGRLSDLGVENILVLRGDLPADGSPVAKDFPHATDLLSHISKKGSFCLGAACYPDRHPESESYVDDIGYLREKAACGAEFFTTQMFFDNDLYYAFLYRMLRGGVTAPVVAGIMPVVNVRQIIRSAELSGTTLPPRMRAIADRFGGDPAATRQAGIAYATEQIIDLFAHGVDHVHIYTMNRPETAAAIMNNISDIVGK